MKFNFNLWEFKLSSATPHNRTVVKLQLEILDKTNNKNK